MLEWPSGVVGEEGCLEVDEVAEAAGVGGQDDVFWVHHRQQNHGRTREWPGGELKGIRILWQGKQLIQATHKDS